MAITIFQLNPVQSKYWPVFNNRLEYETFQNIRSASVPSEPGISQEQYSREIDEAVARVDAGHCYTHEEVLQMLKEMQWTV